MKVLMVTDTVGGVWSYSTELRDALRAQCVEVVLVATGPQEPVERIPYRAGRLEWQEDPWEDVAATGEWLLGLCDEIEPDVVHLNDYAHGALDWPVPCVVVGHSDVLSWHEAVRGEAAPTHWDRYREVMGAGLAGADAVVAPTVAMLRALGVDGVVINHGVCGPTRTTSVREPVVLAAGRLWDEAKGIDTLDAAAALTSWPVVVAGDQGEATAEYVTLLGPLAREDLRRRMRTASILAHPARYEPFGLVVLEAAAAGCALVLGAIDSLCERWDDAALFVTPGDPDALATALEGLSHDRAERDALAEAAAARARCYTATAMAREYASLYASLQTAAPAGPR